MLNNEVVKKIEEFIYAKPRSIQEIALHIGKNWRTADRYIEEIEKEYGTLSTRTFRGGTRGALKIVYWSSIEKVHNNVFQEKLTKEIETFKKKEDFSAFDIYQHIASKDKKILIESAESEEKIKIEEMKSGIKSSKKTILSFSGNLSWINLGKNNEEIFNEVENIVKQGIKIKVLCRVDLASMENVEKMLSLNFKHGKELIEIRHCEQPLRVFVIDGKVARLKEIKEPTGRSKELNKKLFIFYTIKDREWVEWLSRMFWKLFSNSIEASKRIEELKKIKYLH